MNKFRFKMTFAQISFHLTKLTMLEKLDGLFTLSVFA